MDSVNSTTFIKRPPCMSDVQEKFLYTKELLSGRIFLGSYEERRYVSVLNEYRDVVIISPEETDLIASIDKLRSKWTGVSQVKWVGVTGPDDFNFPDMYCFWVKLTDLPFGQYWFQIKHVKLFPQEIMLQLKCIRKSKAPLVSITPVGCIKENTPERMSSTSEASSIVSANISLPDSQKIYSSFKETCINTVVMVKPYVTLTNFIAGIKMGCAILIVIVMSCVSVIGNLGEFVLKLIREVTLLINAFTPIIIQLIDFLTKIVGGFYILIARLLVGNGHQPNYQFNRNKLPQVTNTLRDKTPNMPTDWRKRNQMLRQELFLNK